MDSSTHTALTGARPGRTLVIMAKAPKPGSVKTRLMVSLPPPAVIALYRCLLEDTLDLAISLTGVEVAMMCPESDEDQLARLFGNKVPVVPQTGEGLAAGLTSVFRHFTAGVHRQVVAFNSDSPHLAPSILQTAFEILTTHDVVVGPTHDGGYYLVGAKAAHPTLFENDRMGTRSALDTLLTRTQALGLATGFTERFYDIDVPNDLILLERELQVTPAKAPRTAAWFVDWRQTVAQLRSGTAST